MELIFKQLEYSVIIGGLAATFAIPLSYPGHGRSLPANGPMDIVIVSYSVITVVPSPVLCLAF